MDSPISSLSSAQLLERLSVLAQREIILEADLLAHIGEVDARRLYLREGCSSMFAYCVRVLRFAESVAYKRIAAARAARKHPEIVGALRRREIHLTGVSLLAPQLTNENARELLAAARHKTSDEIRRMLANRQPKPVVAASMRRLSMSSAGAAKAPVERKPQASRPVARPCASAVGEARSAPATREPLGGERFAIRFTADHELHAQIQELRALMRHQVPDGDVGEIVRRAVSVLLKQVRQQKFGECEKPRAAKPAERTPSRQIPAAIRRAVSRRDGERCTYVSAGGRRCGAREFLEFHHCDPWARKPSHDAQGITLRCRAHNQYAAARDFGEHHMAAFRERGSQLDSNPVDRARP